MIFQDAIRDYDFWGITDIDIVFGRIREFMSDELLKSYEVVSVRNDYPTGSFMLFKNTFEINNLFSKSKDYKKVFTSETHYCFDECNFKHSYLESGRDIFELKCEVDSMHHVIKREEKENNLKAHFDLLIIEGLPGQLKWENGKLTFKNEFEVLLHHLIKYKSHHYTRKELWREVPNTFFIDKYLIRKTELNSLKGLIEYFLFNKLIPSWKKKIFKTDYFISKVLNMPIKGIIVGKYSLNGRIFEISKEFKNHNLVSFDSFKPGKINKSIISKNSFFIESLSTMKYQFNRENLTINEIFIQGHFQTYTKI